MNTANRENYQLLDMSEQYAANWSSILIKQHIQLKLDIENITKLLAQPSYCVLQLDAKIKRLVKGVKVHLQLEHTFLSPALEKTGATKGQKKALVEGYYLLHETCDKTTKLACSLMLHPNEEQLKSKHITQIKQTLHEIASRIAEEDTFYSLLETSGETYV
jgi:hypothetical protein